jgi:hypothetical protein
MSRRLKGFVPSWGGIMKACGLMGKLRLPSLVRSN